MPNNCYGTVTLYASNDRIKEVFSAIRGIYEDEDNPFDFNTIIPMPKSLDISADKQLAYTAFICDGERLTKEEFLEHVKTSKEKEMLCGELTRYLLNETKDERISRIIDCYLQEWDSGNASEMLNEGTLLVSNIRNYGAPTWYEWCCEYWGTKWNSCDTYVSGNSLCFWTAWAPCLPIIEAMSKMFPDVIIDYWHEESGMGFCGREVYLGGKPLYTEEADLEEHWIDDDDFEQFGYSEGYQDRQTQITEETSEFKKGNFSTREDRDECVFITNGTFIDYNRLMNAVIDRFGRGVMAMKEDDDHFRITVNVAVSHQFYGWVFGLGNLARIVGPEHVKQGMMDLLESVRTSYDRI